MPSNWRHSRSRTSRPNGCIRHGEKRPAVSGVTANIRVALAVRVASRHRIKIVSATREAWERKRYRWQVDAAEIAELLRTADDAQRPRKRRGSRTQAAIREIAAEKWPGGCGHIELPDIKKVVGPILEKRGMRDPGRDTYSRALGRRDD
jgi:hypothetical protein